MIFVLLPAYNEENGIRQVLNRIHEISKSHEEPFRVVVVDDGSRDRTNVYARSFSDQLNLKLISFPENRGVAEVFKAGFKYVCEESVTPEQDICIVLDSDNTQDPLVMNDMIKHIRNGEDIVIASRFKSPGHMIGCPWYRSLFSLGVSWLLRIITRLPKVKDYSTFYRAYRIRLLRSGFERFGEALLDGKGFAVMGSFLLKLSVLTSRIIEVPLVLRYDLKAGKSGNKIVKTICGYLELIRDYKKTNGYRDLECDSSIEQPHKQ